jgi:hypothetical protein
MKNSPHIIVWHLLSRKVDAIDNLRLLLKRKDTLDVQKYQQENEQLEIVIRTLDAHIVNVNKLAKLIG